MVARSHHHLIITDSFELQHVHRVFADDGAAELQFNRRDKCRLLRWRVCNLKVKTGRVVSLFVAHRPANPNTEPGPTACCTRRPVPAGLYPTACTRRPVADGWPYGLWACDRQSSHKPLVPMAVGWHVVGTTAGNGTRLTCSIVVFINTAASTPPCASLYTNLESGDGVFPSSAIHCRAPPCVRARACVRTRVRMCARLRTFVCVLRGCVCATAIMCLVVHTSRRIGWDKRWPCCRRRQRSQCVTVTHLYATSPNTFLDTSTHMPITCPMHMSMHISVHMSMHMSMPHVASYVCV